MHIFPTLFETMSVTVCVRAKDESELKMKSFAVDGNNEQKKNDKGIFTHSIEFFKSTHFHLRCLTFDFVRIRLDDDGRYEESDNECIMRFSSQ